MAERVGIANSDILKSYLGLLTLRRLKTAMQEMMFKAARVIRHAKCWVLGAGCWVLGISVSETDTQTPAQQCRIGTRLGTLASRFGALAAKFSSTEMVHWGMVQGRWISGAVST